MAGKAIKSYVKNVKDGAKIVGSAIKSVAKNVAKDIKSSTSNLGASVINASGRSTLPGSGYLKSTQDISAPKKIATALKTGVTKDRIIRAGSTGIVNTLASQNKVQGAISGFSNKLNQRSSGISGGSNRSSNNIGSTSISANGSLNPDMTGTSDSSGSSNFLSPAGQTGLGSNVSSVPTSSVSTMNPLNANEIRPTPEITLPEKKITEAPTIAPVVTPETQPQEKDALTTYLEGLNQIERPSSADAYLKAQRETDILRKQQAVNDLSGQLNAIVNKGQASQLSLIGQGRGIPEAIIGGQQAQIGRETAIAALPIQAQLQAAQGNLEMANDNLDTLFKMYSDDAKNEYEYKREVKKAIYDHASAKEKRALELKDKLDERAYQETKDLQKEARAFASEALKNGQASLGAKFSTLAQNVNSPTYQEDLANLVSKLKDPVQTAQLRKLNAEITKLDAENNQSNVNGVNEDLTAYASQYSDTGKLPSPAELKLSNLSVGQVTAMAKQIPKNKGAVVSIQTGTKSNSISAEAEKDFQKLYNVTEMTKRLKELDKKRVGGLVSGAVGKIFGSEDQGEYLTLRKAIVDEMSRMQSGAALTPDEIAVYNDYLPGRYSETFGLGRDSYKKIGSFETAMNQKLQNRLSNNGLSIYGYSKVPVGNVLRTVGEIVDVGGVNYRVLPDGTLTDIL